MREIKAFAAMVLAATVTACISNGPKVLFENKATTEQDFRIPAIVCNARGELVAFSDRRFSENGADIGYGKIEIQNRISRNNGRSWDCDENNPRTVICASAESGFDSAHGDPAVVCDRESGRILLMCASGDTGFPDGGCKVGRYYSEDGGRTFVGAEMDCSNGLPASLENTSKFFTSGRICQSRTIKRGSFYRIYAGLALRDGAQIFFSDDFGLNWEAFGDLIPNADESAVEELPDGTILHSCRIRGKTGRLFRLYTYCEDSVKVSETVIPEAMQAACCNGELLMVPFKDEWLLLQSVPASDKRENLSIYWKRMNPDSPYRDISWYKDWDGVYTICTGSSAYSTMVLDSKGNIALLYEKNNTARKWVESYDVVFQTLRPKELLPL